jgi:hypothetical protein
MARRNARRRAVTPVRRATYDVGIRRCGPALDPCLAVPTLYINRIDQGECNKITPRCEPRHAAAFPASSKSGASVGLSTGLSTGASIGLSP